MVSKEKHEELKAKFEQAQINWEDSLVALRNDLTDCITQLETVRDRCDAALMKYRGGRYGREG